MKLSDFCILFFGLFVCLFLGRELRILAYEEQLISKQVYEKKMDRLTEDALMDVVETQLDDGSLVIRTKQIEENYERLLRAQYDLTDDDCKLLAKEAVSLYQFGQYPYEWSSENLEGFRDALQRQMNERKRERREAFRLQLEFPYITGEDWYQMPAGPQLFLGFDPREWLGETDRVVFSASRIVKLKNSL